MHICAFYVIRFYKKGVYKNEDLFSKHNSTKKLFKTNVKKTNEEKSQFLEKNNNNQLVFKGDKGALTGMALGAVVGLGVAALTIATGGLAAVVAAAGGATAVAAGGAGVGAQVGGIIGGLTSDD